MTKLWLKHVAESNPKEIDIPEISLTELFTESVRKYSSHTAVTFFSNHYTYEQLDARIKNVAKSLQNIGVGKSVRVALMLPNCPQYPISYYTALLCGATVVQVNPMYKSTELLHVLND
ncbi:AMP-binding protein [Salipaludibacillus keqinensis]|uniref:AMP-binding protein n=1 Tax=Salipaludibacillus keqinensis TaxID=2045207 RepID=UPI001E51898D|nr:AMP-binding protein [Salipaludibacillus keqinensis]